VNTALKATSITSKLEKIHPVYSMMYDMYDFDGSGCCSCVLQLLKCGVAVAQQMLQNGLSEVLCNGVYRLHETSSAECIVNADIECLFSAVARVAFWYVHTL